ncbi:MAG: hypothetical protein ACK53X_05270 [Holosporales bacterium]
METPSQIDASLDVLYRINADLTGLSNNQKKSLRDSLVLLQKLGVKHYNADAPHIQKLVRESILREKLLSPLNDLSKFEQVPLGPEDAPNLYRAYVAGQIVLKHDPIKVPSPYLNTDKISSESPTYQDSQYCARLSYIVKNLDKTAPMAEQIKNFLEESAEIDTTNLIAAGQQQNALSLMGMMKTLFGNNR